MDLVLLAARLILAAVFVVAGLAKLVDRAGSRQALRDFGVPAFLVAPFGILLPLAELATAALLLPLATAWWGSLAALGLLLLFVAGIGVTMARGQAPDCHCFGQLHSEPVGWPTLLRNGVLATLAALVVISGRTNPGSSVIGWLGQRSGAEQVGLGIGVVVALALFGEGWLLLQLMQQNGRLLARVEALEALPATGNARPAPSTSTAGLPVGTVAPAFRLSGLHGETMTLDALKASGKPVLLIFSDPHCGPCNALLPELGKWQREETRKLSVVLISRGSPEENRAKGMEHGLTQVLLQENREVAEAYESYGTPSAVLISPEGRIGSTLAMGAEQIRQLVQQTTGKLPLAPAPAQKPAGNGAGSAPRPVSTIGRTAPAIDLPDLEGKPVSLQDFQGKRTLVLFWNPGCGFCQRMVDDLKAWEANPPKGAPALLIVTTGTVEANRAMGLRSTMVMDQGFNIGRSFGATGTPSAVLVEADGTIGSQVAVGAQSVLALAGSPAPA